MSKLLSIPTGEGKLRNIGTKVLSNSHRMYYECVDCGTEYPVFYATGQIMCNGHSISLCPWCRKDSRPWFAGRGK